jgi:small-conductance mechanosensitive channel
VPIAPIFVAAGGVAGAALLGLLRRAALRLPRRLARRRGDASLPHGVALALVGVRGALWTAMAWLASEPFALTRMARRHAITGVGRALAAPLFTVGERVYSALDVAGTLALVAGLALAVGVVVRLFRHAVLGALDLDDGFRESVSTLLRWGLGLVGGVVVLQSQGVDFRSIAIVASVLGLGLGFGLQNIANNLVSGLLLNLERPIRPGDFVAVGAFTGTVERVGARSTRIRTLDRVTILVPNSRLLETEVVNWSHGDPLSRVHVPVGVSYGSNLALVRRALIEAATDHPSVVRDPRPQVQFRGFGDSSLDVELLVWTLDPQNQPVLVSDLNFRIAERFAAHGIQVPFPQRDLHLRSPALDGALRAVSRRLAPEDAPSCDGPGAPAPAPVDPEWDRLARGPAGWTADEIAAVVARMRGPTGVEIADRRHLLTTYPESFVGADAVRWLRQHEGLSHDEALAFGRRLVDLGRIRHVLDERGFRDGYYFYRFTPPADGPARSHGTIQ